MVNEVTPESIEELGGIYILINDERGILKIVWCRDTKTPCWCDHTTKPSELYSWPQKRRNDWPKTS